MLISFEPSATSKVFAVTAVPFAVYSLIEANESVSTGTIDAELAGFATDAE